MIAANPALQSVIEKYNADVAKALDTFDWTPVHALAAELLDCWKTGRQVFFCGNGGSSANAIHMANDFLYGISKKFGSGLNCHALSANPAVMTCLANDEGYDNIFSYQLGVMAQPNDVLIVLSGSGNSANILEALKTAKEKNLKSYAILGYSGGKAKDMADTALHFAIDDMEIAEDLQMIVAHIVKRHMWGMKDSLDAGQEPFAENGMRFLLIGGNSTLGKALGDYLTSRGHEIISTTRRSGADGIFFDLQSSAENWPAWPDNIDAAFIASAITKQNECVENPALARFINVEQTTLLVKQLMEKDIHIVYPSTNIVLACNEPNQSVDAPLSPIGIYAETKAEMEKNLCSSPLATIARLPKILDGRSGILKIWSDKLAAGENIEAFDDLLISPVSISRAVEFLGTLMESCPEGIWHLSGAGETSYLELARLFSQEKGKSDQYVTGTSMPPTMAAASPRHPSLDMSKTTKQLGISAQTSIEMLRDCFKTP